MQLKAMKGREVLNKVVVKVLGEEIDGGYGLSEDEVSENLKN